MKLLFEEQQKFTQWWLWLLLATVAIVPFYAFFQMLFISDDFGENLLSDKSVLVTFLVFMIVIVFFLVVKLKTEIDQEELRLRFLPFTKKTVKWSDVKSARVLKYGFVGGWGIRLFTHYGTVYNTKGNKGLAIELENGDNFLIGTQKQEELSTVIENLRIQGKLKNTL